MEQAKKWKRWEKKYSKKASKLAAELNKLMKSAPEGVYTPNSFYTLADRLREWGL